MAVSYMDFTAPSTQFTSTLSDNPFFKKDAQNYINVLSVKQLNTLGNASLLDIFLSTDNVVEPHIHQNSTELVYCIAGGAIVSILNPFTKELLNFTIAPGQVANVPQGWWHYEIATQDNTHLLAIFDAPIPEVIFGSDILRLTPASILAHTYCLDEAKVKDTLAPITDTVILGPPLSCTKQQTPPHSMQPMMNYGGMNMTQMAPGTHQQANQTQHQGYHYPYRPITGESETYYAPLDQPFHPVPFLYRRWG
ncbi:cupin domain-containing protein [Paenibacillus paeoniae]|uniref:Cupin domain-containing protein n=1 Tax=Paenibacillus paeoniae TaxID=2292705 RepID=A0A371P815_9BACL|nr:cupin domain-containing protein [Paenibacillus paeoniae]REK71650.1 cupin domain-containing protein [Paenibacillus paeoniae]